MKESATLEFKENTTNTFLKTVSAFANYNDGIIMFGVNDHGKIVGLDNLNEACEAIENKIFDTINPVPDFSLEINHKTNVISLYVKHGSEIPYFYNSKSYIRKNTSTKEVDKTELKRLVIEGMNLSFDKLDYVGIDLSFNTLANEIKDALSINSLSDDVLVALNLMSAKRIPNNGAAIFSDENTFSGTDIVKFGNDINHINSRKSIVGKSILTQYHTALSMYKEYYQYESIQGFKREHIESVPENAFREALANALIHRHWDSYINVNISMFDDRIEITSPGGLPKDLSVEEYVHKRISVLRNPILANVFFRLDYIEQFGTGTSRILEAYTGCLEQPKFDVSDNFVTIVLPAIDKMSDLDEDAKKTLKVVQNHGFVQSSTVTNVTSFSKSKAVRELNKLKHSGYIKCSGNGPATKYYIV